MNQGASEDSARGRFTRMIDREFISDALKKKEQEQLDDAELAAHEERSRETRRMETALSICERFGRRNEHLKRRFRGMQIDPSADDLSLCLVFPPSDRSETAARLEFQVEVSHHGGAFHVHSRVTLGGKTRADRLSCAERKLDLDRIDRFIERKILDFVRDYVGDEAPEEEAEEASAGAG